MLTILRFSILGLACLFFCFWDNAVASAATDELLVRLRASATAFADKTGVSFPLEAVTVNDALAKHVVADSLLSQSLNSGLKNCKASITWSELSSSCSVELGTGADDSTVEQVRSFLVYVLGERGVGFVSRPATPAELAGRNQGNANTYMAAARSLKDPYRVQGMNVNGIVVWEALLKLAHENKLDIDSASVKMPDRDGRFTAVSHWTELRTDSKCFAGSVIYESVEMSLTGFSKGWKKTDLNEKCTDLWAIQISVERIIQIRAKSSSEVQTLRGNAGWIKSWAHSEGYGGVPKSPFQTGYADKMFDAIMKGIFQ